MNPKEPGNRFLRRQQGFALVAVLAVLLVCALLIVLLLDRATVGLQSASNYRRTEVAKTLADMAVSRVQAQILDATTRNQKVSTSLGNRSTWASQPGAIRVYGPGEDLVSIYKLYSAQEMQTSNPNLSTDVDPEWYDQPALYTDLNEPMSSGGKWHYPILNPDWANPGSALRNQLSAARGITEGFSIGGAPVDPDGNNQAPMPVRWIYVLQDGTHCQLGDIRITEANPIIGRIAFWTDDETAKVNINTASPARDTSFWDVPRAGGSDESKQFGLGQPSQNEYHRFPGHPAMVSLRPILGSLGNLPDKDYFQFSPYYRWGGSENGDENKYLNQLQPRTPILTNKEDRSYVSVDELLFKSSGDGNNRLTPDQVGNLHFFLTAGSRAPELNLFGQPRVTIWPIHVTDSQTRRTPFDSLIAFCSTIGGKEYFFKRFDPMSPTRDFEDVPRNEELYEYLQRLTGTRVPGFPSPATFLAKYGEDRDQILTEIFDYIRTVNLNETYKGRDANFVSYTPDWRIGPGDVETLLLTGGSYPEDGAIRGSGFVVPIEIGNTRGFGRFPVLAEAGIWFIRHLQTPGEEPSETNPWQLEALLVLETITPAFGYMPWCGKDLQFEVKSCTVGIRTAAGELEPLIPTEFSPVIHYPPAVMRGHTMGGYDGAVYTVGVSYQNMAGYNGAGLSYKLISAPINLDQGETNFELLGGTIQLDLLVAGEAVQSYTLNFPGATLPIPEEHTERDEKKSFGGFWKPWWAIRYDVGQGAGPYDGEVLHSLESTTGDARLTATRKNVPADYFVPHKDYGAGNFAHGFRLRHVQQDVHWVGGTAGSYVDGVTQYTPINPYEGAGAGVAREGIRDTRQPKISSRITSLRPTWSGDFDNGVGSFLDGPFINKPDEGMVLDTSTRKAYFDMRWTLADGLFSPLRQIPSPVMFGSLLSGAKAGIPWRTLLFCPNPADPGHFGFEDPADHLLLDLFRMPVVEPLAISGPASTDGKINMNYAIAPFDYIRRATAMYAALETLKMFSVPDDQSAKYRRPSSQTLNSDLFRKRINIAATLSQFESRFASNDLFRSATEICTLFLVPDAPGVALSDVENLELGYWSTHRLTGDNSRERPYAELYPKLTTQSNTYRVHFRVQALPPSAELPAGRDDFVPLAEFRGSRLIERYLDPYNPRFESDVDPDEDNLNELYQFRILEARQFNP